MVIFQRLVIFDSENPFCITRGCLTNLYKKGKHSLGGGSFFLCRYFGEVFHCGHSNKTSSCWQYEYHIHMTVLWAFGIMTGKKYGRKEVFRQFFQHTIESSQIGKKSEDIQSMYVYAFFYKVVGFASHKQTKTSIKVFAIYY